MTLNLSALAFGSIERLRRAGQGRLAVVAANAIGRGRRFHIDADGDWIHEQGRTTFASPDVHAKRLSMVDAATRDEFLWRYTPKYGDVVFDVGAGMGDEVVTLSPMVGRVYAVEAHPGTFRCLTKTIALSKLPNVTPLFCALTDRDGETSIASGENHLANSIGKAGDRVPTRSLASLCAEHRVERLDFLKMNIEGAERLAVQGFGNVPIRRLAISCHDFVADATGDDGFRTKAAVRAALEAQGFKVEGRTHERRWTRHMLYASKD
ncbi:FkbM family methyltransferase [Sphingomonas ginkgonis]|uniref:FkbM family methyltransferase n=1 Tax=Sphingomonas ginkgonis TaxID=2315330 RepID=A0A3R9YHP2_9SPHN|nr:FkbM family methyltransferase [Sphingomonas ginkgonis]RST30169.1 FkbM family methyltransferase [Sphingomonas ginkgonis]